MLSSYYCTLAGALLLDMSFPEAERGHLHFHQSSQRSEGTRTIRMNSEMLPPRADITFATQVIIVSLTLRRHGNTIPWTWNLGGKTALETSPGQTGFILKRSTERRNPYIMECFGDDGSHTHYYCWNILDYKADYHRTETVILYNVICPMFLLSRHASITLEGYRERKTTHVTIKRCLSGKGGSIRKCTMRCPQNSKDHWFRSQQEILPQSVNLIH